MTHQKLTQSPCTVFLGILVSSLDFQYVNCTKLLVSVQYTVSLILHSFPYIQHKVGITSRTSSTQVRRAFLAKYWSCRHTPRSISTLQNLRYSGYLLCAFLASSAALPTRNVRGREVTHGEQKQCGQLEGHQCSRKYDLHDLPNHVHGPHLHLHDLSNHQGR